MAAMSSSSKYLQSDGDLSPGAGSDSDTSTFNLNALFGALKAAAPNIPAPDKQLEYLFEDEYVATGPSWGARLCYGSGITYLSGLAVGGTWGLVDGLRNPSGRTARLRINCILNSCTARGPFVANNTAILALLYNLIHGAVIRAREGRYDEWSSAGSAALAGLLYKSTKGPKAMGLASGMFGAGMLAFQLAKKYYNDRMAQSL